MRAVILAAGTGSRMGKITEKMSKAMVEVNGKRLIDYLLEFIDLDIFEEILIVGGFQFRSVRDHVSEKNLKNVRVVENTDFLKGNIFTMLRGLKEFGEDSFLLTNADHIYPPVMFDKMQKSFTSITAMCDFDRTLAEDDMKVKLRSDNKRIEKISKMLNDFDCGYIGMTYVDSSMYGVYRKAVQVTLDRFGDKAVVENVLQVLADNKDTSPCICDLSGFGWYEVDTKEDHMKAEKAIVKDKNFL